MFTLVLIVGIGVVVAFNSNPANPSVFGHSLDEIEVSFGNGLDRIGSQVKIVDCSTSNPYLRWDDTSQLWSCDAGTRSEGVCSVVGLACLQDNDCCSGFCYADDDDDGYASGSPLSLKLCQSAASSGIDCYDILPGGRDAYPGQTAWFDTDRGDGSFDYDCNSIEEKRWDCLETLPGPGCYESLSGVAGWNGIPDCGLGGSSWICRWGNTAVEGTTMCPQIMGEASLCESCPSGRNFYSVGLRAADRSPNQECR